ncbi:MAG: site-specific integrase [Clostridiales bacterium]|nr:site-specific integrase [Clostridiales bacterium]MDY4171211.1 tyrosine-type recombinase/integrase [Evtepia sp.]
MSDRVLTEQCLTAFRQRLLGEEKSPATVEKYMRDARSFWAFTGGDPVDKELMMAYKASLLDRGYAVRSVNSMLASLNSLLAFLGWEDCRVKHLKTQRQTYCAEDRELTKAEYRRLLGAATGQLSLILQTICSTGIRVSELRWFTVEAVRRGEVVVRCKSKTRTILLPGKLRRRLLAYARRRGYAGGVLFRARTGRPLDRGNIWRQMKRLCAAAQVPDQKVFPHNLRKLFARTFYAREKDIAKLADLLGHSSIDTTRIYIISTGTEHRRKIENLGLVV